MRNALGYILGFLVFVAGIPAVMWWVSGRPFPWASALPWAIIAILLMIPGLALSIWSIVHMKRVGEGNPFDAYNHEVAPRTKHLMTDGPYKFSRNPMLVGVYILLDNARTVGTLNCTISAEDKKIKPSGNGFENGARTKKLGRVVIPSNEFPFDESYRKGTNCF